MERAGSLSHFSRRKYLVPMRTPLLALMCSALILPACLVSRNTVNEPLDEALIAQMRPGETTAAQVVELLGAPTEVVQLGRRSAYRFDATTTKQAGLFLLVVGFLNADTRSDRLWAFFDEQHLLTHYGATLTAGDPEYALPWEDVYD